MGRVKRVTPEELEELREENKKLQEENERLEARNDVLVDDNWKLEEQVEGNREFDALVNELFDWVEYHKPRMHKELRKRFEKAGYARQLARR